MAHGLSAIVLCGGQSRRMGRDKALLPFGGVTLAAHVVSRIRPWVDDMVLSARPGQTGLPALPVVYDTVADGGPLPAVVGALAVVRHERVLIVSVDTPWLVAGLIPLLQFRATCVDVAVPWVDGHPVMALSVVARSAVFRVAPGLHAGAGLRDLLPMLDVVRVSEAELRVVDPRLQSFRSCNTPDEFQALVGWHVGPGRTGDGCDRG
jgi:molybdopterin-guanine dinucleotide biosynthesis protein A